MYNFALFLRVQNIWLHIEILNLCEGKEEGGMKRKDKMDEGLFLFFYYFYFTKPPLAYSSPYLYPQIRKEA